MKSEFGVEKVYNKCYYRIFEVLSHIQRDDFWLILHRRVLDLSSLMKSVDELPTSGKNQSAIEQLNMFGGSDVSDLFLKRSKNKLEMFDLKSFSEFGKSNDLHWWNDPTCVVGSITAQERHICVRNKSKGTQCHLTVCEEDSIYVIRAKYFALYPNEKRENIIWRKTEWTCCPSGHLFLDKTLTENGLKYNPAEEVTFLFQFNKNAPNSCDSFK